jgi:EAL domain-containing protein (putative c-di-GMP-specific phosphodiesterase class I)
VSVIIGREQGDIVLGDPNCSSRHAELRFDGRGLEVRDLESTNGTFVNGQKLSGQRLLQENDLVQFADAPFRIHRNRDGVPSSTRSKDACDQALAMVQFDRLIVGRSVIPHYQPIVDLKTGDLIAFEALARSRLVGLETPDFMFTAAAQLGQTIQLSEALRRIAAEDSVVFPELPHLFLNTHPAELEHGTLLESCQELRRLCPQQRITIEIHEAAITRVEEMAVLCRGLGDLGMTLAFDDFGAGSSRIAELIEVRPRYLKFDRTMIRNLESADASRLHMVESLVAMVRDVGIIPLAEGVETAGERDACREAGFLLSQGYYHGKPMMATHYL